MNIYIFRTGRPSRETMLPIRAESERSAWAIYNARFAGHYGAARVAYTNEGDTLRFASDCYLRKRASSNPVAATLLAERDEFARPVPGDERR